MEEERKENQREELDSSTLQENSEETSQNGSALAVSVKNLQIQMNVSGFVLSVKYCWLILHRQQSPRACPRSPSPLCYQRPCPPCYTQRCPLASTPSASPAETWPNTLHQAWSNYRRSWETWGTSLIRWRVNTSTSSLKLSQTLCSYGVTLPSLHHSRCWEFPAALITQLSSVSAKKLNSWWTSSMRRKGFAWLYRCGMKTQSI